MINPIQTGNLGALAQPIPPRGAAAPGGDFADLLRAQLERVSQAQGEADRGVEKVLTGQTQDFGDVFVAARKAEIAFGLLLEMRNKLVEAYEELRQLRI
jgi:flagellar hook-basal body complex protein FliE